MYIYRAMCLLSNRRSLKKAQILYIETCFSIDCDYIIGDALFWEKRWSLNTSSNIQ